jgi:TATA-binding protein-associated factor
MLAKRAGERQFLNQLLDGSKVEEYVIPVEIKAELRKYQRDGVSWLAFLAKYQLHGILCDGEPLLRASLQMFVPLLIILTLASSFVPDMGLGKSLQSLTILASKHHERAERFKQTASPDSVHLPSIIVCPPTLTGHWYHEILKFTPNLKPLLYVGPSQDRPTLLPQIAKHDVVIMSYDIVRNDIAKLGTINWNYCILDEGHIIKNGKTKLTKAVKLLRANHRLILSGTPIQNNVLELWSLFDFLMPGFLGSERSFNERFGKPITITRDGKASAKEREAGPSRSFLSSASSSSTQCLAYFDPSFFRSVFSSHLSCSRPRSSPQTSSSLPPPSTQRRRPRRSPAKDHPGLLLRPLRRPEAALRHLLPLVCYRAGRERRLILVVGSRW